jgi:predicted porin
MNKKLIAVAVAGMFVAPAAALAQSSVTISGFLKGGFEHVKYGNFRGGGLRSSQSGVVDDSSRIIFNVVEDLGGGLQAIGQVDMRVGLDTGLLSAAGNDHVGLRSKSWGRIFLGRQDLHYFNRESDLTGKGSLRADSISLLAFAGGGGSAIAAATRTTNVIHYTTPNWGGFTLIAAYSSNPFAPEADLGSAVRTGRAWHLNPNMAGANWQIGYGYWTSKSDATLAGNQRGDRLYGSYRFPMGFKIGLAWDKSRIRTDGGGDTSRRTVWSLPMSYTWGNHSIHGHYTRAGDDKVMAGDEKSRMFALSYQYDLSKRTSAALTYASIRNSSGATYNFFTGAALGVANLAVAAGEDPRMWGVTLRHAF